MILYYGGKVYEYGGQFHSFENWVNKASVWIGGTDAVCFDAQGRHCRIGADFMRAREEMAFPVSYYLPVTAPRYCGRRGGEE